MAIESQYTTDGGKSHSHQKYVVAQGNVVLRALPREAQSQIRHCEIALVEYAGKPQGERHEPNFRLYTTHTTQLNRIWKAEEML